MTCSHAIFSSAALDKHPNQPAYNSSNNYIVGMIENFKTIAYELIPTSLFSTTPNWELTFNYIESSTSVKDLAKMLEADSRPFTTAEAESYDQFIDDFFE